MRVGTVKTLVCPSCKTHFQMFIRCNEKPAHECGLCALPLYILEDKKLYWQPFTPYYNKQLDKTFHTAEEERSYTKKNGMVEIRSELQAVKAGRRVWKHQH
jgi:hypothetical protein